MKFHAECVSCLIQSNLQKAEREQDPRRKAEYMQGICRIMEETDLMHDSAPLVDARIIRLRRDMLGLTEDYTQIKHDFNALLLGVYDRLLARVSVAADPLAEAIKLSMAGNYIDYGVVKDVNTEKLMELISQAAEQPLDIRECARFAQELNAPGELIYLHDNCGEIVLDKLLIETMLRLSPGLRVISVVRGNPVQNDATIEDAREVGLTDMVEVIDNGVADVAGTQLDMLPPKTLKRVEDAKMLIAKGQGNFETLIGCGLNVYYLFLCKCDRFVNWFGLERYTGVFMNEQRPRV